MRTISETFGTTLNKPTLNYRSPRKKNRKRNGLKKILFKEVIV